MLLSAIRRTVLTTAGLCVLSLPLLVTGCNNSNASDSSPTAESSAVQGGTTLVAAGKAVFDANGCARCHSIGGQGGRQGPDLSRAGAKAGHTPQWFVEQIKDPRTHNPSSHMPAFGGTISDNDSLALGAYLASLK
jgi:mono/diheme cytochrome c family protein